MKSIQHFLRSLFHRSEPPTYQWNIEASSQGQGIAIIYSMTLRSPYHIGIPIGRSHTQVYVREMIFNRAKLHPTFEPLEHISRATQKLPLTIIAWNDNIYIKDVWVEKIEEQVLYPDRLIVKNVQLIGGKKMEMWLDKEPKR